jgi:dipeptidyl aminopeptidase/acylaminoacyl peptidase
LAGGGDVVEFVELTADNSALGNRRWFYSPQIDLVVWTDSDHSLVAFELYYDKAVDEHVLIWRQGSGFTHLAVEDGEQKPVLQYKQTPILVADGHFDLDRIRRLFQASYEGLPPAVAHVVRRALGT